MSISNEAIAHLKVGFSPLALRGEVDQCYAVRGYDEYGKPKEEIIETRINDDALYVKYLAELNEE